MIYPRENKKNRRNDSISNIFIYKRPLSIDAIILYIYIYSVYTMQECERSCRLGIDFEFTTGETGRYPFGPL